MSTRVIQKIIQFIHLVLHRGFGNFTSNPYIFKINNIVPRCSGTFIKNKAIRTVGIFASFALTLLTVAAVFPIAHKTDTAEATYVPATTTLSIVSSKDTASVDITPTSSTGTFATSAAADMAEFTVTTDNLTGYSLNILGTDTSGQLVNSTTGDTLDTITSDTTENDFRTGNTSTYNNKWGYRLNVNSTTTTDFFSAPTSTSTAKTIYTTSAPNTTGTSDSFTLGVGARVDYTKPVGTYTNTFVITAIANNISYQINYLDSDTTTSLLPSDAESNISASSIELNSTTPTKSGYEFKGWCDGTLSSDGTSCTGAPGTTYQPGDTYTFTSIASTGTNITNLYAIWEDATPTMQDFTPAQCKALASSGNYTLKDTRDNNTYTVRYINGNCWMTQNLAFHGTTLTPDDSDVATTHTIEYKDLMATNGECDGNNSGSGAGYTNTCLYYKASDSYNGNRPNAWYNYKAVTAGTISGSSNSNNPTESICPKGWKLPTYSQFSALASYVGSTGGIFTPVYGGHINDHALIQPSNSAFYWLSASANGAYLRYVGDYRNGVFTTINYGFRAAGYNARCILNSTMQNFTTQEAESMATGETKTLADSRDNQTYTVAKLADGNVWMTRNLAIGCNGTGSTYGSGYSAKTLTSSDSNVNTNYTTSTTSLTAGNSYDNAYQTCNSTYGAWYNYAAATAKTITGSTNTNESTYDICPKGWRLPTNTENATLVSKIGSSPASFNPVGGGYYANGTINASDGRWWSSTSYSTISRYRLYYSGSAINTSDYIQRNYGTYVRCIFGS